MPSPGYRFLEVVGSGKGGGLRGGVYDRGFRCGGSRSERFEVRVSAIVELDFICVRGEILVHLFYGWGSLGYRRGFC